MRGRIAKLGLVLVVLAGSLAAGLAPRAARAIGGCQPYICCDANCYGIRLCHFAGGSCLCEQFCRPNLGGGSD